MQAEVELQVKADAAGHPGGDQEPVEVAQFQAGVSGGQPHRVGGELGGGPPVHLA